MGQRLSHAFMNAYFKQGPSRANLYCSPEWGCWLKANYTLQIWPLVKTLLIWHSLDSGLGACLWAPAPDSHASVSANHRGTRRQRAWWMLWGLCLEQWQASPFTNTILRYLYFAGLLPFRMWILVSPPVYYVCISSIMVKHAWLTSMLAKIHLSASLFLFVDAVCLRLRFPRFVWF